MVLYKLFSSNVEIQYKSDFLSKAMFFTLATTILNLLLPFILAYRSRGFWLRTHNFYEQPTVHFAYEYLLVAITDDPSQPIVCAEIASLDDESIGSQEHCAEIQANELDINNDGRNDILDIEFKLNIPEQMTITSVILILGLDFQLKTICPLHMQSLAVIDKEFSMPSSGLKYFGDVEFHQVAHLPCVYHNIDTKYNVSLLNYMNTGQSNLVDFILGTYFMREVTTQIKTTHSRSLSGLTGAFSLKVQLRIPETNIRYIPSLLQEFKWAWPQYLSFVVVFYWIFNKIKEFVFNNRLLMAWKVVPWKRM